jgi:hypothetical protein
VGVGETGRREGWTVSDQNQWPKPGETPNGAGNGQPDGSPAPDAPQGPDVPQAPSAPEPPQQPTGQQQNPYGAPQQQNPYGAPQQPNSYGAPQQSNPYVAPQQQNPYGGQQQNPYGAPQQSTPYAQQQNAYGAPQNPYGQQQNPYAQQQPYASNPYSYQPYAQRPKTNVLSILSIVFAFGGIIIWPIVILTSPTGAILGHVALSKIRQTGEGGRGLALAGIIGGWIMTGLFVLIVALVWISIANSSGYSSDYGYDSGTGALIR